MANGTKKQQSVITIWLRLKVSIDKRWRVYRQRGTEANPANARIDLPICYAPQFYLRLAVVVQVITFYFYFSLLVFLVKVFQCSLGLCAMADEVQRALTAMISLKCGTPLISNV